MHMFNNKIFMKNIVVTDEPNGIVEVRGWRGVPINKECDEGKE